MENNSLIHMQEVVFSSSDPKYSRQISRLEKGGKLRKIAPRIYTPNLSDPADVIIRRNLFTILGHLYPGALLSHRSALEFQPTPTGHIFLTYSYTRKISLPGITLRIMEGHGPIEGDNILSGELYVSQLERALLENLEVSRKQGPESKIIPLDKVEERLEMVARVHGEKGLNTLRDKARGIADALGLQAEFKKLEKCISAILRTHPSKILSSPLAMARAFGHPYDPARLGLFEKLFIALRQQEFSFRAEKNTSTESHQNFAFFEAYFSNYIEGTEFELADAMHIIASGTPMPARDEDSHDILGTYKIVSNLDEMRQVPLDANHMLDMLLYRHQVLLSARTAKHPGKFKDRNNRAGNTHFVDFTLVRGTLIKGFDYYNALTHPFARAAYIMFLISEVHPFLDGNGRIARIMMNAELVHHGQAKIIIPTVFREDYLGALRKLSRQEDPSVYIRMLERAHLFSHTIIGDDMRAMQQHLEQANAFEEHGQAILRIPGE